MENTTQNFIDSISPILRQVNTVALKMQHITQDEKYVGSAISELSNVLKLYVDLLGDMTGLEFKSLEETLKSD